MLPRFAILSLLASATLLAQGGTTTATVSTSRTQTVHTTNAAAEVNNYLTRLTARIGAGPLLYDQSFNAQLTDPTVQTAIQQARTLLTGAGANSILGPNQLTTGRVLTGTSQTTVVTRTETSQVLGSQLVQGPGVQLIGDRGLCAGLIAAPGGDGFVPTGCPGGTPLTIIFGNANINVNTNTQSDIFQTATTTSTYLTSQTYELNGTAPPAPPATPAPPSFWLALSGGAAAGLTALTKRFRK